MKKKVLYRIVKIPQFLIGHFFVIKKSTDGKKWKLLNNAAYLTYDHAQNALINFLNKDE